MLFLLFVARGSCVRVREMYASSSHTVSFVVIETLILKEPRFTYQQRERERERALAGRVLF